MKGDSFVIDVTISCADGSDIRVRASRREDALAWLNYIDHEGTLVFMDVMTFDEQDQLIGSRQYLNAEAVYKYLQGPL